MRLQSILAVILLCSGCATAVKQSDVALIEYDKNTKYAIEPTIGGFNLSIYYSRYQFVPESDAVAIACKQQVTAIAYEFAKKQGKSINSINEQTIRLSMGRNGLSGITSCSATAEAIWKTD